MELSESSEDDNSIRLPTAEPVFYLQPLLVEVWADLRDPEVSIYHSRFMDMFELECPDFELKLYEGDDEYKI